jgi:thiamine biosynthesis lipoprotein ApbE
MHLKRRQFFLLTGGAMTACLLSPRARCAEQNGELCHVHQSARALGTTVSITALHESDEVATRAVREAFAELELVESLMSIYRTESQVSQLNRDGYIEAHPYLLEVLANAAPRRQLSRLSCLNCPM